MMQSEELIEALPEQKQERGSKADGAMNAVTTRRRPEQCVRTKQTLDPEEV